jgi:hypothetical protein
MLAGLVIDRDRALLAAADGYTNATDLADYLVRLGVPFRDAHHQVGRLVRTAIAQDRSLEELSLETIREQAPQANQDVFTQLTVGSTLEKRSVEGGTSLSAVEDAIMRVRRMLRERAIPDHRRNMYTQRDHCLQRNTIERGRSTDEGEPCRLSGCGGRNGRTTHCGGHSHRSRHCDLGRGR